MGKGESMTNVFYMIFGILIFVFGQLFQYLFEKKKQEDRALYSSKQIAETRQETKENLFEVEEDIEYTSNLHENDVQDVLPTHTVQTYDQIIKTPTTPPSVNADGLYDYTPSLHEDIDVEIMTPEREYEIYKHANVTGGV